MKHFLLILPVFYRVIFQRVDIQKSKPSLLITELDLAPLLLFLGNNLLIFAPLSLQDLILHSLFLSFQRK